jgi:hypothetical protein
MVKGILADVHMRGFIEALVREMKSDYWADFWKHVGPEFYYFEDVGLTPTSTDLEIWHRCQAERLILLTDNRNQEGDDSLESAIRLHNQSDSLPVLTIGSLDRFGNSKAYAKLVVETLYDYLMEIDRVRGAGRLYLP